MTWDSNPCESQVYFKGKFSPVVEAHFHFNIMHCPLSIQGLSIWPLLQHNASNLNSYTFQHGFTSLSHNSYKTNKFHFVLVMSYMYYMKTILTQSEMNAKKKNQITSKLVHCLLNNQDYNTQGTRSKVCFHRIVGYLA